MQIQGHSALVTGGASGLGAATAEALAKAGAKVAVLDLNMDLAQKTAARIGAVAVRCDVADEASAAHAIAEAASRNGPARILVNCAGIGTARRIVSKDGPFPLAEFERTIKVNLTGSFNMIRLAAAEMQKVEPLADGERGVFISTASVAAFEGQIGQAAYSASKGGIVSMNLVVAREFAQFGIRSIVISPGLFHTPMMASLPEEATRAISASVPFPKRLGHPEEYAALAVHCVSNMYLNGEVIRLDGSLRLAPR